MLLKTAIRIILHEKTKFAGAVAGVALAMSLVLLQWGFYFGYQRDTTVVINLFDADLWIIPKGQTSIDGFTTIDEQAYWKAKDLPEIDHRRADRVEPRAVPPRRQRLRAANPAPGRRLRFRHPHELGDDRQRHGGKGLGRAAAA